MKRLFILLVIAITSLSVYAKIPKVKIKLNTTEKNVQITTLSKQSWKVPFSFRVMDATLMGISIDGELRYFLELNVNVDDEEFVKEDLIVKLKDESIVEVPFAYTRMADYKPDGEIDSFLEQYIKYAKDQDLDDEIFAYLLSDDTLQILIQRGIEKMRVVHKKGFDDWPIFKNCLSEYLEQGSLKIKESQKQYSKYDNF